MLSTKGFIWLARCEAPEEFLHRAGGSVYHHAGGGMELHPPLYLQLRMAKRQGGILCHRWQRHSMIVMFAPEGCVINGVDSELYNWEEIQTELDTSSNS